MQGGIQIVGREALRHQPLPQRLVECSLPVRARPAAPGLEAAFEAVDLEKAEIGEDLRVFAAGIAVIAIDEDRRAPRGDLDHGGEGGDGDLARALDVGLGEGAFVAYVEHQRGAAAEQGLRLVDADTPEGDTLSHDASSSGSWGCRSG